MSVLGLTGQSVSDPAIDSLLERAATGGRLAAGEALRLFESHDLLAIGRAAHARRMALHPEPIVTYIIDRNINYTNVCLTGCTFCAFHCAPGEKGGYVIEREVLRRKILETYDAGGRQILLQGGLNPTLSFEWHEDLVRWLRREFPDLHLHAFSPPEIVFFARQSGLSVATVIERLRAAGLSSIPGGGAEILSDRVREKLSPKKCTAAEWLNVMRAAHQQGLRTTATMMFGFVETLAERVEHLVRLRELQDETGGFTAFACWTYQPKDSAHKERHAGAFEYLKTAAIARLVLDNFANIQASWVTQGDKIAQLALRMGVNDLGSLMLEENVVAAAGTHFEYSKEELRRWAREAGFELRERNFFYESLRVRA